MAGPARREHGETGPAMPQTSHLPCRAGRSGLPQGAPAARDRGDRPPPLRRRVQLAQPGRRSCRRPGAVGTARHAPRPARDQAATWPAKLPRTRR